MAARGHRCSDMAARGHRCGGYKATPAGERSPRAVDWAMPQAARSIITGTTAALFWAATSACSGDAGTSDTPTGEELEGTVSCEQDPRLDAYADLDKSGDLGVLSFRLAEVQPAPPAKGNNTFRLQITDAGGVPMTGDLHVDLKMPDHGHGTSVKPRIAFDPATQQYTVEPLYLFMPGVWRIQLEEYAGPAAGATPIDRTALFFCIEG